MVGSVLKNVVTVAISVLNISIRTLNINLISRIGLHTLSEYVSLILTSVFIASYINSGVILLLTNANFSYYSALKWILLRRQYADMNETWYNDIAQALF